MARYNNNNYEDDSLPMSTRQRDLVLASNEFAFIMAKTNGAIKTYTGPITMTISAQESLVVFNSKTKKFEETQDFEKAKQLFVSAPEGWYVVLKNPAMDNSHPEAAKAVNSPELEIGRKINIAGPVSFSLFPGQMTRVVRGHRLRSNQYLLARVYDADAAKKSINSATIVDTEGKDVKSKAEEFFVGQMLIIKGTEVSFYIPPTGIEVLPMEKDGNYVRDAVTLERLEYAILKDEDGEKRYIHGPAVVFPKPTETFVTAPKGGLIFRALELSPISGIYVKVIAAYDEKKNGKNIHHPIGEELFITGKDQMIYYPRPEHAMIQYDGKYMHHAIAIPEGEGRYILNRLTGEITTVRGPQMYLPDPRTEVVVRRKLTRTECELLYPGNKEVIEYNNALTEKAVEKLARKGKTDSTNFVWNESGISACQFGNNIDLNATYSTANQESTLAIFEANANISRGVSYTKPRTITLDTKYEGVVAVDVWTGYAMNVVSKNGKRDVVVGPTTRLLNYDETVEAITIGNNRTAFLKTENNKVSHTIDAQTADFVSVQIKLNYNVNFLKEYKDSWFAVNNYTKYLCDNMASLIKREIKKYKIKDFYAKSTEIIRELILEEKGRLFEINGMIVTDVDIMGVGVEKAIANLLEKHQTELIQKGIELADAEARMKVITELATTERKEANLKAENAMIQLQLEQQIKEEKMKNEELIKAKQRANEAAAAQAKSDLQEVLNAIQTEELKRAKEKTDANIAHSKALAEIEQARQEAYANTVKEIMASISPDLVAALNARANSDMLEAVAEHVSPYAMAKGESVSEFTNRLLRGTSLEGVLENMSSLKKQ